MIQLTSTRKLNRFLFRSGTVHAVWNKSYYDTLYQRYQKSLSYIVFKIRQWSKCAIYMSVYNCRVDTVENIDKKILETI